MRRVPAHAVPVCAAILTGFTVLAALGAPAGASAGQRAAAVAAQAVRTGSVVRFNVGATHSPELERQLAGHAATPSAAGARPADLPAAASALQGIDVASFQHPDGAPINWSAVASARYKFAFIKATEGSYYVNPYESSDAAGAQAAGLLVAPYAFAIPNYSSGALQADYLYDSAGYAADGQSLPLVLDIEYDPYAGSDGSPAGSWCYGLTPAAMTSWISSFVTETQRRSGHLPVIYSTAQWWNQCTDGSSQFAADPLWLADYPANPASLLPAGPPLPAGFSSWEYWQYTSSATLPAATSVSFDASYLSSSALELADQASQSQQAGSAVSLQVNGLNGTSDAATFSASGLPPGLTIDPASGAITGTLPGSAGSFPVIVTATTGAVSATSSFSWLVHAKASLGNLTARTGTVGSPVRYQVPATDGLKRCSLDFSATGLPAGLTITPCGLIAGWPSLSGSSKVTVRVSDSSGATLAQGSFGWTISNASGSGPAGQIRLARDGKCLAGRSASDVAIEPCTTASDEHWTVAADGTIRLRGQCLTAAPASGQAPAALAMQSCRGAGRRWQLQSGDVLANLTDGRCLAGTGSANGSRAAAAVCVATSNATGSASTPSSSQQWTLPAGPLTSGVPAFCASSAVATGAPAGTVSLRGCNGSAGQSWTLKPNGFVMAGSRCLSALRGSLTPGTDLQLVSCVRGAPKQLWQLAGGPIGVQLRLPVAGLCASDPSDSSRSGTVLALEPCVAGHAGETWRVS